MIKITYNDGNKSRSMKFFNKTMAKINGECHEFKSEVKPEDIFIIFFLFGYAWQVDYSEATAAEHFLWFQAELSACILRALSQYRPVVFLDKTFFCNNPLNALDKTKQAVEEAIKSSGQIIKIDRDDEQGLVIGTHDLNL